MGFGAAAPGGSCCRTGKHLRGDDTRGRYASFNESREWERFEVERFLLPLVSETVRSGELSLEEVFFCLHLMLKPFTVVLQK